MKSPQPGHLLDPLLKDSKVFCMAPWVSMNIDTDGNSNLCCMSTRPIGNVRESSLRETWNSASMRRTRLGMLRGEPRPECAKCYEYEAHGLSSLRRGLNERFSRHFSAVASTRPDGTVEAPNLALWDVQFSNLCNFRCRYCSPTRSSRWHPEASLAGADPSEPALRTPTRDPKAFWRQLEEFIPAMEEIYFTGGEPLIMEEHYRVLDALIERRMFHVRLRYNTNFSVMMHRGRDVMKLWDRFEDVLVGASLDASGRRGEYIRKGLDWDTVLHHRKRMAEACPRARFQMDSVISVMNLLHFPDFCEEWLIEGYAAPLGLSARPLLLPVEYRIQILPARLKEAAAARYEELIRILGTLPGGNDAIPQFRGIIRFMLAADMTGHLEKFKERTRILDQSRGEKFSDVFPELAELA